MSLVLVAALLLCCVPALGVQVQAADFNGVYLPDFNTTIESYPFKFIMVDGVDSSLYYLYCYSVMPYVDFTTGQLKVSGSCLTTSYKSKTSNSTWILMMSPTTYDDGVVGAGWSTSLIDRLIWCDFDLCDQNGNVLYFDNSSTSSVSSVSIVSPDSVLTGLYVTVSVDVSGSGDFDSSATLTLSGNTSSGTYLEKSDYDNIWNLFCGEDETASNLTVTAASVQDPNVTASTTITVEHAVVDPTDPSDPDDPDNPTDPSDPTTPEETQPGNSGALTDKSDEISDGLGDIHDFEQSQKDVLDNNMDFILGTFAFDDLIPALAFVGLYVDKAFVSMAPIQLIYFVPLVIGLFFFICSRAPGATRWKPRRPPPDPTKKK